MHSVVIYFKNYLTLYFIVQGNCLRQLLSWPSWAFFQSFSRPSSPHPLHYHPSLHLLLYFAEECAFIDDFGSFHGLCPGHLFLRDLLYTQNYHLCHIS